VARVDALGLGLGTGIVDDRETCASMVRQAVDAGYRHVDTAQAYGNEASVAEGLDRADVDRDDVVVATKVSRRNLAYDDVHRSVAESRERLGVDAIDLLYVHWPTHAYDPAETLPAFDELHADGTVANVGLCNVTPGQLAEAIERLDAPVAVCQFEHHPLFQPTAVVELCREHDIRVVGYAPLGDGRAVENDVVRAVAAEREMTPGQVCLAWALANDVVPIPRSTGAHIEENLAAADCELTDEDVARIDAIESTGRVYDPEWAAWN